MTEFTTYEQVGDVALISMDDGKANAFGPPMIAAVNARLDRAADDAKGVVLTGRPGIFSGGFVRYLVVSSEAGLACEDLGASPFKDSRQRQRIAWWLSKTADPGGINYRPRKGSKKDRSSYLPALLRKVLSAARVRV